MKLRELAEAVGMVDYAVVAMGVKRYEARLTQFAAERKQLTQVAQLLNFKM